VGIITITAARSQVVDFTESYMEEKLGILINRPPLVNKMFRFLAPFAWQCWVVIFGSLLVSSIFVWYFSYCSPFSIWNLNMDERIVDEVSYIENLWSTLASFCLQGCEERPPL